jgi:hypothetical protein
MAAQTGFLRSGSVTCLSCPSSAVIRSDRLAATLQVKGYDAVLAPHRIGSCRRELLDRTLIWNQRHLMTVLREYEDFYNTHRPHRALNQAAPLGPLPDGVTDLNYFRLRRRNRAGGGIDEYRLVA